MSGNQKPQSFGRRTWDEAEYAKKAQLKASGKAQDDDDTQKQTDSHSFYADRMKKMQQIDDYNRVTLISAPNAKEAGFYCDTCHRKFKDNLKFLEHLNSREHLSNAGFDSFQEVRRYTLEDVKKRLDYLKKKIYTDDNKTEVNMQAKIIRARETKQRKREKRQTKRRVKKVKLSEQKQQSDVDQGIMQAMGFANFGSS